MIGLVSIQLGGAKLTQNVTYVASQGTGRLVLRSGGVGVFTTGVTYATSAYEAGAFSFIWSNSAYGLGAFGGLIFVDLMMFFGESIERRTQR